MSRFLLLLMLPFCLCLTFICSAQQYALPYDNVPITKSSWEQIDIQWHGGYAQLLRPINYAHDHCLVIGGHVQMDLTEFGVPKARVIVTAVKSLSKQTSNKIHHLPNGEKPIIGIYVHKTNDVRTYRFVDKQGHISTIHATPNHRFYVENLQAYIPINQISDSMQLVGKNNEIIHIICPIEKHQECGIPYKFNKTKTVYNIETYQKHIYKVGKQAISVHNFCITDLKEKTNELHVVAQQELKGIHHQVEITGSKVKVSSRYIMPEVDEDFGTSLFDPNDHISPQSSINTPTEFLTYFSPETWEIDLSYKNPNRAFHANDVFREQYIAAVEKTGLEMRKPLKIINKGVTNQQTLDIMKNYESGTDSFRDVFLSQTPNGKRTNYIIQDFGLSVHQVSLSREGDIIVSLVP